MDEEVLVGAMRDTERYSSQNLYADCWDGRDRRRIIDAQDYDLIPLNLGAWIGHRPTGADLAAATRSYRRLEKFDLVEIHREYGRQATGLFLTEAGKVEAKRLISEHAVRNQHSMVPNSG